MPTTVTGIDEVTGRLHATMDRLRGGGERATTKLLLTIEAYAMSMTPVDTSAMINSVGRELQPLGDKVQGWVYYGAEYAKWVHEMPGTLKGQPRADFGMTREGIAFGGGTGKGNYWDPNGEPQFLKKAGNRAGKDDAPRIFREEMGL